MAARGVEAKTGERRNPRCPGRAPRAGSGIAGPLPSSPCRALVPAAPAPPESFSKIVLASAGEFPYSTFSHGGVAQLGERLTGSQEVRGSIPLVSTRALNEAPTQVGAFFHIGTQGQRRHHDPPGRQDRALNGRRVHGSISRRGATLLYMEVLHYLCNHKSQGLLAQRLAQGTHNPWVLGSNPGGPTRFFNRSGNLFGLFSFSWQHFPAAVCLPTSERLGSGSRHGLRHETGPSTTFDPDPTTMPGI